MPSNNFIKQLSFGETDNEGNPILYDIKATCDVDGNSLRIRELTQSEYDRLSTEEKNNGTTYYITDGNGGGASGSGSSGGTVDAYTKSQTDALLNTKANTADLATVATSGSYNDLSNKPTNVSDLTNDAGYLTSIPASSVAVELTQAEYNALSNAEKNNGTTYYITDAGIGSETASNIGYSNSTSNLSANTVQGAIDEVVHTMNTAYYYNHESDLAWTPNTSVVGNNYSGINIKNGFVSVQISFFTSAALSSGTEYTAYTLPDELKELTGSTYVHGVAISGSTLVRVIFNTWDSNVIKVVPGEALSKGARIYGNLMFPIT